MRKRVETGGIKSKWMLTFSDISTLMLTFFVLLFGISYITPKGIRFFKQILNIKIQKGVGKSYPSEGAIFTPIPGVPLLSLNSQEISLIDDLSELYENYKGEGNLKLYSGFEKLTLIIGNDLLFPLNSWSLTNKAKIILSEVALKLRKYKYKIIIEGHTDSTVSPKISNEELSIKRALSVLNYLVSKGLSSANLGIAGYGDSKPLYPETDPISRAKNRRVEITIYLRRI